MRVGESREYSTVISGAGFVALNNDDNDANNDTELMIDDWWLVMIGCVSWSNV